MDDCVAYLAEANEAPRDSTLGHYLAIQRLADDVSDAFGYDGSRDSKALCGLQIELYLRSFQARASQIRHSIIQECFENGTSLHLLGPRHHHFPFPAAFRFVEVCPVITLSISLGPFLVGCSISSR